MSYAIYSIYKKKKKKSLLDSRFKGNGMRTGNSILLTYQNSLDHCPTVANPVVLKENSVLSICDITHSTSSYQRTSFSYDVLSEHQVP